jgi:hypothetical protein
MISNRSCFALVAPFVGLLVGFTSTTTLGGCSKSEDQKSDTTRPTSAAVAKASGLEAGFVEVPNEKGLQAKVPETLEPNGLGGAAGFHAKAGKLSVMINELEAEATKKSFAEAKKENEEVLFKKWISSEKTVDGWVMQWEGEQIEGMGASHNFEVKKVVGGKTYKCYGSGASAAEIASGVEVCKSLKAR